MKASSSLKQRGRILSDPDLCRGCEVCLLACSLWQEGENYPALARLRVEKDMVHYTFSFGWPQSSLLRALGLEETFPELERLRQNRG
ncbi:MAG: hypothetical protein J7M05_11605 [Anaerolineae bacterium]|nr:hypothetical protein [Anaerolineae bacterium]